MLNDVYNGKILELAGNIPRLGRLSAPDATATAQASSSIMARHVIGAKPDELRALRETVRKMLKENGPPPDGRWADIAVLEPVRDYKARHASTLLTFDAVVSALDQIEQKQKAAQADQAAE